MSPIPTKTEFGPLPFLGVIFWGSAGPHLEWNVHNPEASWLESIKCQSPTDSVSMHPYNVRNLMSHSAGTTFVIGIRQ